MSQEYANQNVTSVLSAMLSGSKLATQMVKENSGSLDLEPYQVLIIQRDQAQARYNQMFNKSGKIYKRYTRDQIQEIKDSLDLANKKLAEYRG